MARQINCYTCIYYGWDFLTNEYEPGSFCGLHGRMEIEDPLDLVSRDRLNGGKNEEYPQVRCGYFPKEKEQAPIQLTLF